MITTVRNIQQDLGDVFFNSYQSHHMGVNAGKSKFIQVLISLLGTYIFLQVCEAISRATLSAGSGPMGSAAVNAGLEPTHADPAHTGAFRHCPESGWEAANSHTDLA